MCQCADVLMAVLSSMAGLGQDAGASRFGSAWSGYFRMNGGGRTAGETAIPVPLSDGRVIGFFGRSRAATQWRNPGERTLPGRFNDEPGAVEQGEGSFIGINGTVGLMRHRVSDSELGIFAFSQRMAGFRHDPL